MCLSFLNLGGLEEEESMSEDDPWWIRWAGNFVPIRATCFKTGEAIGYFFSMGHSNSALAKSLKTCSSGPKPSFWWVTRAFSFQVFWAEIRQPPLAECFKWKSGSVGHFLNDFSDIGPNNPPPLLHCGHFPFLHNDAIIQLLTFYRYYQIKPLSANFSKPFVIRSPL